MKTRKMNTMSFLTMLIGCSLWLSCATDVLTGQTVKETRNLPAFNALKLTMSADVYLSQGDHQSVQVEADKGSLEYIETETNGNTLVVRNREGHWQNLGHIKIYITMPDISEIELSGSGSVESQTPIKAAELKIGLSGSGNVKISSLQAPKLSATITGSGDIYLSGDNDQAEMDATITGSGSIKADEMRVANATIHITGSGSARVNVLKELETDITGSGSVHYKGNPIINAHSTGSGRTTAL
jgi:carbon monoxide dehydrogenase subunit G